MPRRKNDAENGTDSPNPSFEEALSGLEAIVEAMEHEHLTLEQLVEHYEKGSAYLASCETILQSARNRIELITLRNQNEISPDAAGKGTESTGISTASPDDPDDDANDIRLF